MTNDGIASSTALINASCSLERKLTGSDAESFLKTLMKNKWLCEVVSNSNCNLMSILYSTSITYTLNM